MTTNLENAERADMELLPCPFCGGSEIYMEPDERGSGGQWVYPIHVGCSACGVDITCSDAETEDEAAEVWNRRADRSAVGVKPLEWDEFRTELKRHFQANTIVGQYQIGYLGEFETWQLYSPGKSSSWKDCFSRHATVDAAKAAAQQDYEARIRSCLIDKPEAGEAKPIICIGHHTISQLMVGNAVEIDAAIMIPASDLSDPEPGEHQEVLDAIAAHNSGEEE